MSAVKPSLSDYGTKKARTVELRRRRLNRKLVARWRQAHSATGTTKLGALRRISTAQWNAAKDEGAEEANE